MTSLRSLAPLVLAVDTRTTRPPQKQRRAIYGTPQFLAWRKQVVARAGARCEAIVDGWRCGKAHPAHRMYADHIVELRDGGNPFDINNGQCLCSTHHERKTFAARQLRTSWSGSVIWPRLPRPGCKVRLVCGPPAAGKSTYVRDNANPDDIVIDLDAIARGRGLGRDRSSHQLQPLLRERNDRLAALAKEPLERTAWVILALPGKKRRQWWCQMLGVRPEDVVLLLPSRAELKRRVMNDPDRESVVDLQLMWIDKWLMREIGAWPTDTIIAA